MKKKNPSCIVTLHLLLTLVNGAGTIHPDSERLQKSDKIPQHKYTIQSRRHFPDLTGVVSGDKAETLRFVK